jgi:[protein-PII] uridylyltransferase
LKSFLTASELVELKKDFHAPQAPDGDEAHNHFGAREFSQKIIQKVEQKFSQHPLWLKVHPIALGSWARGELCVCSDLDLLFLGPENLVAEFVQDFQKQGVKIRSRIPENLQDWSEGVGPFDVLALLFAKAFTPTAGLELDQQIQRIRRRGKAYSKELLKSMLDERASRNQRYDSIANFLEPNLKFGPGGLRDLHQALNLHALFEKKFLGARVIEHGNKVLNYYLEFWLLLRHKLHLESGMDLLAASEQLMITKWLGFRNIQEFMKEVQKGVSRVNFYSDLFFAFVKSSNAEIERIENRKLQVPMDCVRALQNEKSILLQSRIRFESSHIFKAATAAEREKARLKFIDLIHAETPDQITQGLFRSRLIDHFIPDFKKIVGHVQHDQYHRLSVDAHLLQALRELKRLFHKPKLVGSLAPTVRALKSKDWEILSWTCLLHDLAKGRQGDHSKEGVILAQKYLTQFEVASDVIAEVLWMIDQHLLVSDAAFRKNPSAKSTLRELFDKGVVKDRIARLIIFTAVDIRATNPEAWNAWKEKLLFQLVQALMAPDTSAFIALENALGPLALKHHEFIESLDPFLISSLPTKILAQDLKSFLSQKKLDAFVYQNSKKEIWIRLTETEDRSGVLLSLVEKLFRLNCSINHASITSEASRGVYDWFQVRTPFQKAELKRKLSKLQNTSADFKKLEKVLFESVELISKGDDECIIAFTGRDQSGLLLKAALSLANENLDVKWAKVHTWGRQIQDLFAVKSRPDIDLLIESIKMKVAQKKSAL